MTGGQIPTGDPTHYGGRITPAAIGYTITYTTTYHGHSSLPMEFEQIPSSWRLTRRGAVRAVTRYAFRQHRADARQAATARVEL